MSRSIGQTFIPAAPTRLGVLLQDRVAHILARLREARTDRLTARALAWLGPEQRRDIGAAPPHRPTIEVGRGVMTTLMSLR